jgi:hypothetical protein
MKTKEEKERNSPVCFPVALADRCDDIQHADMHQEAIARDAAERTRRVGEAEAARCDALLRREQERRAGQLAAEVQAAEAVGLGLLDYTRAI